MFYSQKRAPCELSHAFVHSQGNEDLTKESKDTFWATFPYLLKEQGNFELRSIELMSCNLLFMKNEHVFLLLNHGVIVIQPFVGHVPILDSLLLVFSSMPKRLGKSKQSKDQRNDKSEVLLSDKTQVKHISF
jgi:hypothetical protein